jgi:putative phosphoserine phosphatase/1-acylglycerol-3-phosphate O-acyltransferase
VLHDKLTREIREGPSGPKIAAFFDVDRTLLAGFSAISFMRERIASGRVGPTELAQGLVGTLSFALGRTGFSGFVAAHTQAYRGLTEASMDALGQEVFNKHLATQIFPESRALVRAHRERGHTIAIVSSGDALSGRSGGARARRRPRAVHAARGAGRRAHRAR